MAKIGLNNPLSIPVTNQLPDKAAVESTGATMQMPFRIALPGEDLWTLPFEPLVSLRGRNIIIRRNISKKKGIGSVKELWSQDDYSISIRGIFIAEKLGEFPESDLVKLRKMLESKKSLVVSCKLLDVVGITLIAVEDWELPETSGLENQFFRLSGYSDQDFELI